MHAKYGRVMAEGILRETDIESRNIEDEKKKCDYCDKVAIFTENVWGCKQWCLDCEEDAAWEIYNEVMEDVEE